MLLRGRQKTSCFLRPAVCAEVSFVHLLQCLLRGGAKPARSGQREQGRNSRSPGAERTGRPGQKRSLGRSIERCKNKDAGIPKGWPLGRSFVYFWRPRNGPVGDTSTLRSGKYGRRRPSSATQREKSGKKAGQFRDEILLCLWYAGTVKIRKKRRPKAGRRREGKSYDRANLLAFRVPSGNGNNKNPGCLREYGPDGPPPSAVPGRTGPRPGAE